jgi:hypothetical protein
LRVASRLDSRVDPYRVLSHTDVAEAKAEKGRATAEIGDLKQRLADEGQEWAWPLLTSLLGAEREEQEEKKGRKVAKQKEREEEGEEWSLYAALRRHHTEGKEGHSHRPYSQPFRSVSEAPRLSASAHLCLAHSRRCQCA